MMIIPAIDLQSGQCVRLTQGRQGTTTVYSNDPVGVAKEWVRQGARRLHVVDLDGAFEGKPKNFAIVLEIARAVSVPIQVGGGIRSIETAENYVKSGIEYIIFGSKMVQDAHFIKEAVDALPGKIIVGIDARNGRVLTEGWTEESNRPAVDLAQEAQALGAAMLIYTDIERDGMLGGPNLSAISQMTAAVRIPVIASGGVGSVKDIRSLSSLGPKKVAGVIIGKALYAGAVKLTEALAAAEESAASC